MRMSEFPTRSFESSSDLGNYYNSSFPWAGMRFEGLGALPANMISDKGLEEKVEQLVRASTIKTLYERPTLGAIDELSLERALTLGALQDIAEGNIEPITQRQFEQKLYRYMQRGLSSPELAGFFSKITKPFKKIVKKVTKVVKKVTKPIVKAVKKVAPIVIAGAATYFTGGAALPLLQKYSSTIGQYWSGWNKTVGKVLGQAPPPQPATEEVQYITDPQITEAAVPMATYQLQKQGIDMQSPQSQQMLQQYIRYQQNQAQASAPGQPINVPPGRGIYQPTAAPAAAGGGLAKMALPLAIGAGALLLLTR